MRRSLHLTRIHLRELGGVGLLLLGLLGRLGWCGHLTDTLGDRRTGLQASLLVDLLGSLLD